MINEVLIDYYPAGPCWQLRINGRWERMCSSKDSALAVILELMEGMERANPAE